jgi:hypothetical protein
MSVLATPLYEAAAPYVARIHEDFDIDSGVGKVLIEAPPNAALEILAIGGWGQTADKAYGLGIAPPGYARTDNGKLTLTDDTVGPYPLAFGTATLNGATRAIPYSLMNTDRISPGVLVLPAGWTLYLYGIQAGNSGTLSASAVGQYRATYTTSNFGSAQG